MRSERAVVLVLLLALARLAGADVLERILAVVDDRPLFLSDVRAIEAVDRLAEPQALDRLIDETLLAREAARLPQATASAEEPPVPAGSERVAPSTLRRLVERRAAIRRYVDFRFRSQVRVEDEAVRKAYAEQAGGDGEPPAAVAGEIRARLAEREVDARVAAWVRDLRTQARIRYNAPEEGPGRE